MPNLTELEKLVISTIKLHGDDWYAIPHMHFNDISEISDIDPKKLRGVISSLEQKDIIQENELPHCMAWMVVSL
jgi:hypothetical protein